MAAKVQTSLLTRGAMGEGNVPVSNVVEEVNFFLLQEKTSSNGVDGSITPSLVEETTILIEGIKEIKVGLASEPVQVTNLKVGPLFSIVSQMLLIGNQRQLTKWHLL